MLYGETPSPFETYQESFFEFIYDSGIILGAEGKEKIKTIISRFQKHFSQKRRHTGENYSSHLFEVARLYIEYGNSEDITFNTLSISLLHDSIEDIARESFKTLQKDFGDTIALGVCALSKSKIKNKKKRDRLYYERFESCEKMEHFLQNLAQKKHIVLDHINIEKLAKELIKIKVSDRIHNLNTMPLEFFSPEKRADKANESLQYLSKVIQDLHNPYISGAFQAAISYIFQGNTRYYLKQIL